MIGHNISNHKKNILIKLIPKPFIKHFQKTFRVFKSSNRTNFQIFRQICSKDMFGFLKSLNQFLNFGYLVKYINFQNT